MHALVEQPAAVQLAEDRGDTARSVHVLHVVGALGSDIGRDLGQTGNPARNRVHIVQAVVQLGLLSGGEQVQDRVGGATHGDVERHGVVEGILGGDVARQDRLVAPSVVTRGQLDDRCASLLIQRLAGRVGGQD